LAQQVCKNNNIAKGELRSGSRRQDTAKTRGSISWLAVRELGYSGKQAEHKKCRPVYSRFKK